MRICIANRPDLRYKGISSVVVVHILAVTVITGIAKWQRKNIFL